MLWIALFAPELPLHAACGGVGTQQSLSDTPIAVSDGPDTRPHLRACNALAHAMGVREMMSVSQARALSGTLTVLPRAVAGERQLLEALTHFALAFTPMVCIEPDLERHCVLLEISASLKLFGGLRTLTRQLIMPLTQERRNVQRFGRVFAGLAPTPLAAEAFARHRATGARAILCLPQQDLLRALAPLPLTALAWLVAYVDTFHALGLHDLGQALALPRDGFAKRFGTHTLTLLDRCVARAPDPRTPFVPTAQFSLKVDCVLPLNEGPHLLCGIEQTLYALHDWLRARARGTRAFTVSLLHSRERVSEYPVTLSELSCDPQRWRVLLIEHFQRKPVDEPVHAIAIKCLESEPLTNSNQSLLAQTETAPESWQALLDRLHARLGPQAVYGLRACADHRPEVASAAVYAESKPEQVLRRSVDKKQEYTSHTLRPFFLLPRPRALVTHEGMPSYHGALCLLTPPERIQTGWWDDKPVARDYFVARNAQGTLCWIFLSLNEPDTWFLHGFFA
jgi:protein ImuB